jgi:hypothetical protein
LALAPAELAVRPTSAPLPPTEVNLAADTREALLGLVSLVVLVISLPLVVAPALRRRKFSSGLMPAGSEDKAMGRPSAELSAYMAEVVVVALETVL